MSSAEGEHFSTADQPLAYRDELNEIQRNDNESRTESIDEVMSAAENLVRAVNSEANYYSRPATKVSIDAHDVVWRRLGESNEELDTLDLSSVI
jgi:hypothetical protein